MYLQVAQMHKPRLINFELENSTTIDKRAI